MSDGKMTIDSGQVIALLDHARKNDTMGPWSEVAVQCIRAGEKLITDLKTQMAEVTSQRDAAERVWRDEIAEHEKTQARLAEVQTCPACGLRYTAYEGEDVRARLAEAERLQKIAQDQSEAIGNQYAELVTEVRALRKLALEGAAWAALIKPNPPLAYIAAVEHACGVTPESADAAREGK